MPNMGAQPLYDREVLKKYSEAQENERKFPDYNYESYNNYRKS